VIVELELHGADLGIVLKKKSGASQAQIKSRAKSSGHFAGIVFAVLNQT
jgi:hypothetical protein